MAQGEAHLPTGHSKVTMPQGCLWVVPAPTAPELDGGASASGLLPLPLPLSS